jgi:hypothetical protein
MKYSQKISDLVSEELLYEIRRSIKQLKTDPLSPMVLSADEGVAIFAYGGNQYCKFPFANCVKIPNPLTVFEAKHKYTFWKEWEWERTWNNYFEKKNLQIESGINVDDINDIDVKDEFINFTFEELIGEGINETIRERISTFWVAEQFKTGISFEEQVRVNLGHTVIGHFAIIDIHNRYHLFSNEIGHRMHYEDE